MIFLSALDFSLPLENPILKFLVILTIILLAPILLNKIKIPHILGLIIAGAIIGPNGLNLLLRDSSIILSGTAGLLYIMFLAGLEIDLVEFKKNSAKSLVFGMYTFLIPMTLGITVGLYVLHYSLLTSILLASMFASHTLLSYPILSKLGVTRNKVVPITIGGTMITDTLSLLVLAVIVGMTTGNVNATFWTKLSLSILAFGSFVVFVFPIIGRWFFKRYKDNISQYVFVLVMVFFGAVLAEAAGIEGIIGAFLTGLSLNRLIPHTSALMNRIEFVGNAIFIPFFLIGVGMLVDYKAFINDVETIKVAIIMTVVATFSKFLAAWFTQKTFKFSKNERKIIFGLSNAQAAATLAAVLVGYNVILGTTPTGEPIRLLNENILNGTIVMILITCTIATFAAQKGAYNISLEETSDTDSKKAYGIEKILIPAGNPDTIEELINLSTLLKSKENKKGLFALSVLTNDFLGSEENTKANKILEKAVIAGAASDIHIKKLLRYDINIANGISGIVREHYITDLVLGLHEKKEVTETFLGSLTEGILSNCSTTTFVYKSLQPIATNKRHIVIIPRNAEKEIGFALWMGKIWNIAKNSGSKVIFFGTENALDPIKNIHEIYPINAEFKPFNHPKDFSLINKEVKRNDNIIFILSRKDQPSHQGYMNNLHLYINKYFNENSFILVYPKQSDSSTDLHNFYNPSLQEPIEKLDELGKNIKNIFKKKNT